MEEKDYKYKMPKKIIKVSTGKYLNNRAVEKKIIPFEARFKYTRKSHDINYENCKTTEKKLTKEQSEIYNSYLEKQRDKEERDVKKQKKDKMIIDQI